MGFRFWRRKKILPGVALNLSKSGGSPMFGHRGARFTLGPRGRRTTLGIPGTGLFYTSTGASGKPRRRTASAARAPTPVVPPQDRLTLGFFERLVTPRREKALVDGCRELALGNENAAFQHRRGAVDVADGAYLAGVLALKRRALQKAESYLAAAKKKSGTLGRYAEKHGFRVTMSLPITGEVTAHVEPSLRGVLLALVEVYQRQQRWQEAVNCLQRLRKMLPEDVGVKLSLSELLLEARPGDKRLCKHVVQICEGVENESPVHTALLLYKAKALHALGLLDAAQQTLTHALRRKKARSEDLLRALRYERALVYEESGKRARARRELEKLYAEAPDYEDVASRLGLG